MNQGWEEKTLGEVCTIRPHKSELRERLNSDDLVSFVPMEYLGINSKYFSAPLAKNLNKVIKNYTYFADGDVLLAKITPCFENGKLGIARNLSNAVGFGSSEYIVFRPNPELNNEFLYYFLLRDEFRAQGSKNMKGAVGHKRVTPEFIENYPIKFPKDLAEQQRIVEILDRAFEDIDQLTQNAKQNLQNARELFESSLNRVFTENTDDWEDKSLGCIAQIKGGKRVPKGYKLQAKQTPYPYIRVTDFNNYGSVDLNDIHYIDEKVYKQIKNYTITVNDLYISIAGTIGKTGIIPQELNGANLTENACKLIFNDVIYNKFIYYFTKTKSFTEQAFGKTRTAAMPKLALTRLATITLPIPSYKVQQKIVEKLDAMQEETRQLEQIYQQKIKLAEELKQSILQKAFSGELTRSETLV